ncbi:MAG: diguanylate cyclase [Phycisphaeraceae bacterium]
MPDQRVVRSPGSRTAVPVAEDAGQQRAATLARLREIPANPKPLLDVLNCPNDDPEAVATALQRCPLLSARVLGVTNSAAYGLIRPIETVRRATLHLGAARTRAIALAFGLRMISENTTLPPELRDMIWISSLRKAAAAKLAAEVIQPRAAERAYCLALVQDIALPLMAALDIDFYRETLVPGRAGEWTQLERRRFGVDHAELGAYLFAHWEAGGPIVDAVRHHHDVPDDTGDQRHAEDALTRVPLFLASLLPHVDEEATGHQRQWLTALHGQFLAHEYPSPEAFFVAAAAAAAPLHGGASDAGVESSALVGRLIGAVSDETLTLVTQLSRLEHTLHRQREDIDELRFQAFTDPLTNVLNRRGFTHLARHRLEAAREARCGVCCMMLDLDDLKPLNDEHGHNAGDVALRELATLLLNNVDRSDLIGRIGGDEFAILLTGIDRDQANQIVGRVFESCTSVTVPVSDDHEYTLHLSLGAVHIPSGCAMNDIDSILRAADAAMYDRKRSGKHGATFRECQCGGEEGGCTADVDCPAA